MAEINQEQIEEIVAQVIRNLRREGQTSPSLTKSSTSGPSQPGVYPTVDGAIAAAKGAQAEFAKLGFAKRVEIIQAIKRAALEHARRLAELAVKDTKMGTVEHKTIKNEEAANLSPGVEDLQSEATTGDTGTLLVEYVPFGVINSITPTTNPTSTVINHAIIMLAAGNSVVFSPHPNAQECT
ncbi:aldehyde dehydrogenase family protein, partial [Candidatus Poribacteria bacterium]|nr:aldehyde dehydrogenase family protein [Candidatus Poribacteria bacterium]